MREYTSKNLRLHGVFRSDSFVDWIIRRATRLSLRGWVRMHSESLIELTVSGDPVLVDAMEVACSLGPIDAQVDSVDSTITQTPTGVYRQPPQFVRYSVH